jgi:hypothetical protein
LYAQNHEFAHAVLVNRLKRVIGEDLPLHVFW